MADLDKLNAIITKCRLFRQSTTATANEIWLSDLVEALAVELKHHDRDHAMAVTELPVYSRPHRGDYFPGDDPAVRHSHHPEASA